MRGCYRSHVLERLDNFRIADKPAAHGTGQYFGRFRD